MTTREFIHRRIRLAPGFIKLIVAASIILPGLLVYFFVAGTPVAIPARYIAF